MHTTALLWRESCVKSWSVPSLTVILAIDSSFLQPETSVEIREIRVLPAGRATHQLQAVVFHRGSSVINPIEIREVRGIAWVQKTCQFVADSPTSSLQKQHGMRLLVPVLRREPPSHSLLSLLQLQLTRAAWHSPFDPSPFAGSPPAALAARSPPPLMCE